MDEKIPFSSLREADKEIAWFREFVYKKFKCIPRNSDLDQMLSAREDFSKYSKGEFGILPSDDDFSDFIRNALAAAFIVRLIKRDFDKIEPEFSSHLKNFKGTDICLIKNSKSTLQKNKSWELVVALICANFCDAVVQGKPEPDVISTYKKRQWALPCEIAHSKTPETQLDLMIKGIKQVEESEYDFGIVMINISNLIDHSSYFLKGNNSEDFLSFPSFEMAMDKLSSEMVTILEYIQNCRPDFARVYYDKKGARRMKTKAIFWFGQVATIVQGKPVHLIKPMTTPLNNGEEEEIKDFLDQFSRSAHSAILTPF